MRTNPPVLAVAVDNSASMTISDNNGSRQEILLNLLNAEEMNELDRRFIVDYYSFANNIERYNREPGDSLLFLGDATNIRKSLELIKAQYATENLTNILLISDGSYNAGGNPVRYADELGVPIHTIGIGSSDPVTDLAIIRAETNPFTYVDQSTPIQITLRNTGFDKMTVPVEIQHNGVVIARQTAQLFPSPSEQTVTLEFTPKEVGRLKLDVKVPQQAGEHIGNNNSRSLYVDVLKSKIAILLFAGAVSPDISFMKKHLQNDRYHIESFILKSRGEFYRPLPTLDDIKAADIFIFLNFPIANADPSFLQNLLTSLELKKQSILFIPGANTSLADLQKFSQYMPVQNAAILPRERQVYVEPSPFGLNHPIMQVSSDPLQTNTIWSALPPVFAPLVVQRLAPGSEVLAYARMEGQSNQNLSPLIAVRVNGMQKSAAIFAHQLWRWDFMMHGINRSEEVYAHMLQNIVRWLETNRSESLVRVTMDKTHYNYGDPISMSIDVFDENLNPVEKANVRVTLLHENSSQEFFSQPESIGSYSVDLQTAQPGDYMAKVIADIDDRRLGEETVLFSVGEYSAELTDIQAQPAVLQNLSRLTGGRFVRPDSLAALAAAIQGQSSTTAQTHESELWNNKYILALVLLFLTLEWFIRKKRGMV